MKLWYDTEFMEDGRTIELISIGIIDYSGRTYYAEVEDVDLSKANDFVVTHVIPHLQGGECVKPREQIAQEIIEFAGPSPEWWAWYADYDWVALCQLYGTMMDLPEGWPMFCRDLRQVLDTSYFKDLPPKLQPEHNALTDARWCRDAYHFLRKR